MASTNHVSFNQEEARLDSVLGNELRLGKYCMLQGVPCKIRALHRSAPGKHGHAKLRTVGMGIFDGKRRETIYSAHDKVPVPVVETLAHVPCRVGAQGLELQSPPEAAEYRRVPSLLYFPEEADVSVDAIPEEGTAVLVSVTLACGQHKVTSVTVAPPKEATEDATALSEATGTTVLSKKEQRKLKKALKKEQEKIPLVAQVGD